ncbi:hypothetical protein GCM10010361_57120 [Streptomyces olivaceiscleroticus]|uniref:Uncharacterized protein n=1 Tax=Streptomyces olivaceiscleroticus TaxID=68245 RepID=A0ABN1AVP4_9ACTN
MEVKPYTAFVGCPVAVVKFSAGRAKNARYAMECPSIRSSRGRSPPAVSLPVVSLFFAAFAATPPILPRPTDIP